MTDDRSPRLAWTDDGAPRSGRFDDVYFSREDGLAETRAVFLGGCNLPEAWAERRLFTVAELGFGTGLNIAALLDLWRREGPADGRLHVFTVEGFPLSRDEAARALQAWPELADIAGAMLEVWPAPTPGYHRFDLPAFRAVIDLAVGEVEPALAQWSGRADAWFLDGFAPSANPAMWSDAVLDLIAARSAPGARVATFTVAGAVRRGLADRGFEVAKRPGHGRKRERLEAWRADGVPPSTPDRRVIIVGAGVSGASLVRAFAAAGLRPTLIEADTPGAGASGFPAALVTPRLDAGDARIAALYAQALGRARELYSGIPGAILGEGVLQLAQADRDAGRFARVADQEIWPEGAMRALDATECTGRLGETVVTAGLWMGDALAIRPSAVLAAWAGGADLMKATAAGIERSQTGWNVLGGDGTAVAEADIIVIAAGWGVEALTPGLRLAPVAGQADWVEGPTSPPAAWGGYVVPTGGGLLFGATHDRGVSDPRTNAAATERNLGAVRARMPGLAGRIAAAGQGRARVAVRATTPDRLPVAGALADGLFVLGGMGSRGFCAAPLLAEHVAALAIGAPSPLPSNLSALIDPLRFGAGGLAQPAAKTDG